MDTDPQTSGPDSATNPDAGVTGSPAAAPDASAAAGQATDPLAAPLAAIACADAADAAVQPASSWPTSTDPAANPAWARTVEPPIVPVPTAPPNPAEPVARRRSSGLRWGIALIVTALVVGVGAAAVFVLSAGATTSSLLRYVPADSVAYFEVRLDAPGDQHQNAANVLSKFPGFADQANLGTKIDQALDQAFGRVGDGKQTYTGDIKPWLGNAMALAVTRLPATMTGSPGGVWLVQVKDASAAQAWATKTLGSTATSTTTYGGVTLTIVDKNGQQLAYGIVDAVLVAGDEASVKQVVDTNGNSAFATSAQVTSATTATPGDRLAFGYVDLAKVTSVAASSGAAPLPSAATDLLAMVPPWMAISVRAESDGVTTTVALPPVKGAPALTNSVSTIAPHLPSTTIVETEAHDIGPLIVKAVTNVKNQPGAPDVDKALAPLGGLDSLVGWMGDAAVAVIGGDQPSVVVVVQAASADVADQKATQIRNLIGLAGGSLNVKTHDETYKGTTITIIDAGAVPSGLGASGITAIPNDAHLEFALAQSGDLVVIGVGDAGVKAIVDTTPGNSLADQDRYKTAINRAGNSNVAQLYVDLPAVIGYATSRMPADQQASFKANLAPYLAPFQAFAAAGVTGDPNKGVSVIVVK